MGEEKDRKNKGLKKLLKWYMECAQRDEHFNIDGFEKRIRFFSGLNVAIIAAIVAGYLNAETWYDYALLLIGPALLLGINKESLVWEGLNRYYGRFLDAVIVKAHIEQALGLTKPLPADEPSKLQYWQGESPVPSRHLKPRLEYRQSSDAWREGVADKGSKGFVMKVFTFYRRVAIALFVVLAVTSLSHLGATFFKSYTIVPKASVSKDAPSDSLSAPAPDNG